MRKEMLIAIVLGLILGGGVAYALVAMPRNLIKTPEAEPTEVPFAQEATPTPATPAVQNLTLEILLPENQSLTQESEITISGKTKGGALVALSSPIDEAVTTAEDDGAFSERIKLEEGSNEIIVVSEYNGLVAERRITINYTTEEI